MSSPAIRRTVTREQILALASSCLAKNNYKDAARILWPWFIQNEWTDKIWTALEKHPYLCILGHASASKTFTASIWYLCDWLAWSDQTATIITSDTIPSMDRRIWADFKTLFSKARCSLSGTGQIVDYKHMIRRDINDGKHAIHAIAAESDDAQSKIQGIHTKRIRVIIDEADNPHSSSIWSAISNLGTSGDIRCLALANPDDKNSEFGFHVEPKDGWDSINPEADHEWDSKLGWHVLRLDGLRSPNIIAGEDKFPFLLTNKGVEDIREKKGTNSPEWWTYVRGWYPPEGLIKVIFPTGLIDKCLKPISWYTTTQNVAACDPAFEGGDNCILAVGRMGRIASSPSRTGVEIQEFVKIKRKDTTIPITHDFGNQIIEILKERQVPPQNFAIDKTGNGLGLSDYITAEYGSIMAVSFGGSASDNKIVAEDTAKAKDRYKNFVTELWYVGREWCRLGLVYVHTIPRDLKIQLEGRRYKLTGKDIIQAEPKKEMKDRGLSSPDYGDTFNLFIHAVRTLTGGFLPGTFKDGQRAGTMKRFRHKASTFKANYGIDDEGKSFEK